MRRAEERSGAVVFDDHMRFVRSLVVDLRADETSLVLLLVIALFSPDRHQLASREFVGAEQERYATLLRRYLESRHPAPIAGITFARLVAKLAEIRTLNDEHSHVLLKLSPDGIQPLMKEVLDIKPRHSPSSPGLPLSSSSSPRRL